MTGDPPGEQRVLTGWGRTDPATCRIVRPHDERETVATVLDETALAARGLGRSYGDAAQLDGGTVADLTGMTGLRWVDDGVVRVAAGTSLDSLLRWSVPQGRFVPVSPGTRQVTVGGAIAADIHGKSHHADGSFGRHVERLTMVLGDGSTVTLEPGSPGFDATTGGMGLTGIVLDADLRLVPIETSTLLVDTTRCRDLDALVETMEDDDAPYSAAWIDLVAGGRSLGRSVLTSGRFARADELFDAEGSELLDFDPAPLVRAPAPLPSGLLNRATIRAFNEAWYRASPAHRRAEPQSISRFFHPLDGVSDWNRLYGRRGLLQWQSVVPVDRLDVLRSNVAALVDGGVPTFLAVLKRFGPGDPGHLSFPIEGWTLTFDLPVPRSSGRRELFELLDGLDRGVAEAGGRVYFAKDSRLAADLVPEMYPRLDEWRAVAAAMDPGGRFQTDLSRRLRLRP